MEKKETDTLQRFLFENAAIRGEIVHLSASFAAVLANHENAPSGVQNILGQALSIVSLLVATIKFDGSITLQIKGDGPVSLLVVDCDNNGHVRGLVKWEGDIKEASPTELFGKAQLVITIRANKLKEQYQGVIALEGDTLAEAIETYFVKSEHLPTKIWLAVSKNQAAGLLLQILPEKHSQLTDWERIITLASTIRTQELLELPNKELLYRLFNQEEVRLFDSSPLSFRCNCSIERMEQAINTLGREEAFALLAEQDAVEIRCEFCNRHYTFDRVDIEQVFSAGSNDAPSTKQ